MFARLFDAALATRFLTVGLINTAFGYAIILAGLAAGLGDIAANSLGHLLGFGFSYFMHHRFTYRQSGHGRSPLLYLGSVLVAFAVNLGIVAIGSQVLGLVGNPFVHLAAIGGYAVTLYCLGTIFAFRDQGEPEGTRREIGHYWPELAAAATWLLGGVAMAAVVLPPDVSWQLWIGRHLNAGVPLYDWIMETNPPLWYWMAQPISLIAEALRLSPNHVLIAAVWLLMGLSLALSAVLVRDWPERMRAVVLGAIIAGFVVLGLSEFGQREHELLIAIIPYAILTARRAEGAKVHWLLALAVGVLATPMVALKHYFVLLPLGLEIWLTWRRRSFRPIRPETLCLAVGAVAYVGAILIFTPSYLTDMVPVLSVAYGDFRMLPVLMVLNHITLALVVCGFYFWHFRKDLPLVTQAMLVVCAAFTASFYLQSKGFAYHVDPVIAGLTITMVSHVLLRQKETPKPDRSVRLFTAGIFIVLLAPVLSNGPYRSINEDVVTEFLYRLGPGVGVASLSTRPALLWPMIGSEEVRLPLRYYHYWMLNAVAAAEDRGEALHPRLAAFTDVVRQQTVEDMLCNPPEVILEDTASVGVPFDMLGFFKRSPEFAALFEAHYSHSFSLPPFEVYRKVADLPPPTGLNCMTIGVGLQTPRGN